jgi:hypothetical protein
MRAASTEEHFVVPVDAVVLAPFLQLVLSQLSGLTWVTDDALSMNPQSVDIVHLSAILSA